MRFTGTFAPCCILAASNFNSTRFSFLFTAARGLAIHTTGRWAGGGRSSKDVKHRVALPLSRHGVERDDVDAPAVVVVAPAVVDQVELAAGDADAPDPMS